jgi:hypothetical protein
VTNLNDPHEYQAATVRPLPEVHVQWLGEGARSGLAAPSGTTAHAGFPERVTIRAATLGAAAEAVDMVLGSNVVAALNGGPVRQDPEEPLAEGDVVFLARAATGP